MLEQRWQIALVVVLVASCLTGRIAFAIEEAAPAPHSDSSLDVPSVLTQLLRSESVWRDLQLDRSQRQACVALAEKVAYPLFLSRDLPPDARRERIEPLAEDLELTLDRQLTPKQRTRLSEILLRAQGWPALFAPPYADAMQLSTDQVTKMQSLLAAAHKGPKGTTGKAVDTRLFKLLSSAQQAELARLSGQPFDLTRVRKIICHAPELRDVSDWVNTQPLTLQGLRGHVVALHFFAFGCINCIHNQPHYQDWQQRFSSQKFVQLALHTPETEQERDTSKLRADVAARKLEYPIAVDAKGSNWNAWANHLWPSTYLIDKQGYVRYWWYGELNWQGAQGEAFLRERISELLAETPGP